MLDLAHVRQQMVDRQVARRGIRDERVLEAMRAVPREAFLAGGMTEFAYEDSPLPIEAGQTISQPYIVALMTEAAELQPADRVLEIGTGSGYAAAVLGRLCREVFSIERHAELADLAQERLERLHCDNVVVRIGDGTKGWPEKGPFDAIIAWAGGPSVPDTLRSQLAIGGRLIMPVGEEMRRQHLVKLVRVTADECGEEDLGDVLFVPLIGEHGWHDDRRFRRDPLPAAVGRTLARRITETAEALPAPEDPAFATFFDRFGHAKVVLLGEASHGTSEFHRARAAITRRLVEAHGFTIVAAEADWPDAAVIDRHVRGKPTLPGRRPPFRRFPTWMWRNTDVEAFIGWLRGHNAGLPAEARAGFYGLDLYNLSASTHAVIDYLDRVDPEAAAVARERYGCLTPWQNDFQTYGRMALTKGYAPCEQAVVTMLKEICAKELDYAAADPDSFLDASQNARLVRDAEHYYRAMFYGSTESWNLRDRHMFETLRQVLDARGPDAKAVVWAHNSHVGDARQTEMGRVREELNIGQLCRERFGSDAVLIGFGTHRGTVACASDWNEPMEVKDIRPSRADSYERVAHDSGVPRFLIDFAAVPLSLREALAQERLERFIGVIYRPESERWSHYAACALPGQFDAYAWFDETTAVTPLPTSSGRGEDETYPFGL